MAYKQHSGPNLQVVIIQHSYVRAKNQAQIISMANKNHFCGVCNHPFSLNRAEELESCYAMLWVDMHEYNTRFAHNKIEALMLCDSF